MRKPSDMRMNGRYYVYYIMQYEINIVDYHALTMHNIVLHSYTDEKWFIRGIDSCNDGSWEVPQQMTYRKLLTMRGQWHGLLKVWKLKN